MQSNLQVIESAPNYVISRDGYVYNMSGRIIKPRLGRDGYYRFNLAVDGKPATFNLHRLLALAFIPNDDPAKCLVDHKNRNRMDNRLENLRWVTHSQNAQNRSMTRCNSSGFVGVCLDSGIRNGVLKERWICLLKVENAVFTKVFPPTPEGFEQACKYRNALKIVHHID